MQAYYLNPTQTKADGKELPRLTSSRTLDIKKGKMKLKKRTSLISNDEESEVEDILAMQYIKNGTRKFLVRRKGFKASDDTYRRASKLSKTHSTINK